MKIIPSVLIGSMSGKAGPVVFSRWRGIPYARQRVIPANPNTAAQQEQRGFFSQIVTWWHGITQKMQDHCDALALGEPLSGFNAFQSRNVKDLVDAADPRIIPLSTDIEPVSNVVASTGGPQEITLTWDQGEATDGHMATALAVLFPGGVLTGEIFSPAHTPVAVQAEAMTITGLAASTDYQIFVLVEDPDDAYSVAVADDATSGAP